MDGEFARDSASNSEPLPPARTRWAEEVGTGPGAGSLLGPVRSGYAESPARERAYTDAETTGTEPAPIDTGEREAPTEEPAGWDGVGVEDMATDEFVFEAEPGSEIELTYYAEDVELTAETTDDLTLAENFTVAPDLAGPIEPVARVEAAEPDAGRPTPVSAWDLTASSKDAAAKALRAREEWDSLEQALVQSLDTTAGASTEGVASSRRVPTELEELARRLEQFAAALRTDGTRAMEMAQSRGDPIDFVLAAIAAGYISGRRE